MTHHILNMLLDHFPTLDFPTIAQLLHLEHYTEDDTLTISGINFVLDIFHTPLRCMLSFVDESYTPFFKHVETYLNTCLQFNNIKEFANLLLYFTKIDKAEKESLPTGCRLQKLTSKGFWACACVFSEGYVLPFNTIRRQPINYNIFTHRVEECLIIKNEIFSIEIVNNVFMLFNRPFMNLEDVKREINRNFRFYTLVNEDCVVSEDHFSGVKNGFKFTVSRQLDCFSVRGNEVVKNRVVSFLLKRGVSLDRAFDYISNVEL